MQATQHLFADTLAKSDEWVQELARIGGFSSPEQAYSALHAVLPTLRDRLTVEEAAQLASHLPILIRGVYYEGWRPAAVPERRRSQQDFLAAIADRLGNSALDPERACRAVFEQLERRIAPGEVEEVKHMMHHRLRDFWPL
ncbi:MAG TPA: DUF2267 domain-containing protein [Phycisphaerales bacterium]|nr:DUF2267 domain-containing protein [Phycisphaerales bacterium]